MILQKDSILKIIQQIEIGRMEEKEQLAFALAILFCSNASLMNMLQSSAANKIIFSALDRFHRIGR